jgi:hypothetical protein
VKVTILQHGERMLKQFEPDLVGWLMDGFGKLRIDVCTEAMVTAVDKSGSGYRVHANGPDGDLAPCGNLDQSGLGICHRAIPKANAADNIAAPGRVTIHAISIVRNASCACGMRDVAGTGYHVGRIAAHGYHIKLEK